MSVHNFNFTNISNIKTSNLLSLKSPYSYTSFDIQNNLCGISVRCTDITMPAYIRLYDINPDFKFKSLLTGFTNNLIMSKIHISKSNKIFYGCENSKTVFIWNNDSKIINRTNENNSAVNSIQTFKNNLITLCSNEVRCYKLNEN